MTDQLSQIRDIAPTIGSAVMVTSPNVIQSKIVSESEHSATSYDSRQAGPENNGNTNLEPNDFWCHKQEALLVPSPVVDRDLLMNLLSKCLSLVDAANATMALLEDYGTYADAIAAPFCELRSMAPLGEAGADLLKCVHAATIHLATAPLQRSAGVNDWESLLAYLNTSVSRAKNEVLRILFLNACNLVLSDEMMAEGTVDSVNVCLRAIVQRCIQLGATAILIVHNHPSGDPVPSQKDWDLTARIKSMLEVFNIQLHDHVIVGKGLLFSVNRKTLLRSSAHR